jgi:hypothetical protein
MNYLWKRGKYFVAFYTTVSLGCLMLTIFWSLLCLIPMGLAIFCGILIVNDCHKKLD